MNDLRCSFHRRRLIRRRFAWSVEVSPVELGYGLGDLRYRRLAIEIGHHGCGAARTIKRHRSIAVIVGCDRLRFAVRRVAAVLRTIASAATAAAAPATFTGFAGIALLGLRRLLAL
jgi:hypothetical protein